MGSPIAYRPLPLAQFIHPKNIILKAIGGFKSLSTRETADEIETFFQQHKVPQGERTLEQHLEKLWVNVALREREAQRLALVLNCKS